MSNIITIGEDSISIGGIYEVSEALGCSKQQIYSLRLKPEFPAPIAKVAATPLWDMEEITLFKSGWVRRASKAPASDSAVTTDAWH